MGAALQHDEGLASSDMNMHNAHMEEQFSSGSWLRAGRWGQWEIKWRLVLLKLIANVPLVIYSRGPWQAADTLNIQVKEW